jgi:hypothetical protein
MQGGEQQAGRATDGEGDTLHGISFRRGDKKQKGRGFEVRGLG